MIFNLNYTFALSPTAPGSGFSLALTEGEYRAVEASQFFPELLINFRQLSLQ
jgi:hypothetical protein